MQGLIKYKRVILVVVAIGITLVVLYFGGGMLIQMLTQMHQGGPPPLH